jgi:DNA-binding MltR family transcriptional regulator
MAAIFDMLTREEFIAFLAKETDRSKAIVLAAIVENHLTAAIKFAFRKDEKIWNELFQPSGPVGDFGIKIRLAYMAGIIADERLKNDLITVAKIRNKFAHDLSVKSFNEPPVSQWIKGMFTYELIKQIAERKAHKGDSKIKRAWIHEMGKLKRKALRTLRATYVECLGHLLHELITNVEDEHRAKSEGASKRDYPFGSSGAGKMDLLTRNASKRRPSPKST